MTASEDQQLQPRPRPTEIVEIAIATDAIDSLKQIAIDRGMSVGVLLLSYIEQGMKQDLAKQSADSASEFNLMLSLPEEVQKTLIEATEQTGETRETIALQWLIDGVRSWLDDPLEQFIGAFDSGGSDWADHHDQYLGNLAANKPEISLREAASPVTAPGMILGSASKVQPESPKANAVISEIESNG